MELRGAPRGPAVSDEAAEKVLNAVLDAGINFIDTSIDYGRSEELIGRFLAHRRSEYFLASKCGCVPECPEVLTTFTHLKIFGPAWSAQTSSGLRRWSKTALPVDTPIATAIYPIMKAGDGCPVDPAFRIV